MTLASKLAAIAAELPDLASTSFNPHFKSRYLPLGAMLSAIRPVLAKHGVALVQPCEGDRVVSKIIDSESGEVMESWLKLPDQADPQKLGSLVTYYRRYTLGALLGLSVDADDDGNAASQNRFAARRTEPNPKANRRTGEISREQWEEIQRQERQQG